MSPSRGSHALTQDLSSTSQSSTEARATARSSSALHSAKQNLRFLFAPDSPTSPRPAHRRTRALLRALRYIGVFVFWRVVRYAKYALVGSVVAAVGATAVGGAVSGVGFLLAPPTVLASLGVGTAWAVGKWGFRRLGVGERVVEGAAKEGAVSRERVKVDGQWRDVQGPRATPW
ncbi:uncharacterized protein L3040_008164 [Drepanopeziza brunnea f. sp. 'multigermtubi']|uniref:Uncharacterized protein n=1 Tax=Marssonina brunnea f. sp. multigermtubi (strain MB_m1) TaxID=1072389 RepID=K1WI31_MARBU|nr:uncharacterized protein MBM_09377 [Drepanopeziza brunnea f. sp. 'multigermtubi' MB_m1]EKD12511.1 hypothetical protein MBM_09377 [Drepanopeziza brunnea f. sp. 'multigermtubi' MB_m1]KAJ5034896.1 hypothetical protein L3040_008164 [Drepanopeziza brunnea f. sp. 'multigermtubi']